MLRRPWIVPRTALLALLLALGCHTSRPALAGPVAQAEPDTLAALRAVPGVAALEEVPDPPAGYRAFQGTFRQPVDHNQPAGPHFLQAFRVLHRDRKAPVVLALTGYDLAPLGVEEPTQLLEANQVEVEYRFFGDSMPQPTDWTRLDLRQASHDFHALVQALKPLYRGAWLSTGASKGGGAVVDYRQFFPGDVAGTVAYVTPIDFSTADPRYPPFVASRGSAEVAASLTAWQRAVLAQWPAVRTFMAAEVQAKGLTHACFSTDQYLQTALLEAPFTLWQHHTEALAKEAPAPEASAEAHYGFLARIFEPAGGPAQAFCDEQFEAFYPYFHQAATQLGYTAQNEDLPGLPCPGFSLLASLTAATAKAHDPAPMRALQAWVDQRAERMLFLYGENDPFTAAAFRVPSARDNHLFLVPGGNHFAKLADLPEAQRARAHARIRAWAAPQL